MKVQTAGLVSSYFPRLCGLATFTKDLRDAMASAGGINPMVLAMDDRPAGYAYPPEVRFQIQAGQLADYQMAADLLNINQIDVVYLQHEFGIFGGRAGEHAFALAQNLRMPLITTLHTVLSSPNPEQRAATRQMADLSDRLVVMCRTAKEILEATYGVAAGRIEVIPHGIPDVPFTDPEKQKAQFGLEGKPIILTFGLLSPGKGLEVVVEALPRILQSHPNAVYLVLGAIHPHVYKRDGNAYLTSLKRLAQKRGVSRSVVFHSRFVALEELLAFLAAADIYVTPYPGAEQISSGTLAYALGAGKAVVSTPYRYATEMLAEGRGKLFPFGDSGALAGEITGLLDNNKARTEMRRRAWEHGRPMIWKEVAHAYLRLGEKVLGERMSRPRPVAPFRIPQPDLQGIPDISLNHLRTMTDDTGIIQHAMYATPERARGYTTDDNARALVATMLYHDLTGDDSILGQSRTYLSYIRHAFDENTRRFRNVMSYDRRWDPEEPFGDDVQGRALWALGITVAMAHEEATKALAGRLFFDALQPVMTFTSPRAWAFTLVGIHAYLHRYSGDAFVRRARSELAGKLSGLFHGRNAGSWPWCEDLVTYDNAKIPHALILSGQWIPDPAMLKQGLESLEWLVKLQLDGASKVSLIGNRGWMQKGAEQARFDQQPVDAMALVEACAEAWRATRDPAWRDRARQFLWWFLGNNDTESVIYDFETGGCRDGLQSTGPNLNEGAESTLAWLISLITVHDLLREETAEAAAAALHRA
jgi:glycosyltransferase involved in cell wall biosynthesis